MQALSYLSPEMRSEENGSVSKIRLQILRNAEYWAEIAINSLLAKVAHLLWPWMAKVNIL